MEKGMWSYLDFGQTKHLVDVAIAGWTLFQNTIQTNKHKIKKNKCKSHLESRSINELLLWLAILVNES